MTKARHNQASKANNAMIKPIKSRAWFWTLISFFYVAVLMSCGQHNQEHLAKVSNRKVTEDDFKNRYLRLLQMTSGRDNLLARKSVLNALINEEILLFHAQQSGLENEERFGKEAEAIAQQALLEAYAKHIVNTRVKITEADLRNAFVRLHTEISARHLYAQTEDEARTLYAKLQSGYTFEELAAMTFNEPGLNGNGGYLGYFTLGDMDPAFEEAAYNLKTGEVSEPVKTAYGYSIIKVEDRKTNPLITEHDFQKRKNRIEKYLLWVKAEQEAKKYAGEVAQSLHFQFNQPALRFLLHKITGADDSSYARRNGQMEGDFKYRDLTLAETVVQFEGGEWRLEDFLKASAFTSPRQRKLIKNEDRLKQFIQGLVVREHLLKKARDINLQKQKSVQEAIARETRNYTLKRMKEVILDTVNVPERAMREYFEKFSERYHYPEEVNVREILVDSEKLGKNLMRRLRKGEDFSELARRHSLRQWAAERGGELGFAPRGKYGALADTVFSLKPGELIGPLPTERYYSIIQVVGIKERRSKNFEQAKDEIRQELLWDWQRKALQSFLDTRREKIKIEVNEKKLQTLTFSNQSSS
jgi:parvulin-like peptidyl-prolyl isomerase